MTRPRRPFVISAAALVLVVALGGALRMLPAWRGADRALVSDAAFHLRMAGTVAARGRLPAVDSLAGAPQGRILDRWLPEGLPVPAVWFHRVATALGSPRLEWNARLFIALAGALVALPAFAAAWAVFRRRDAALLAASIAVILPAHLHRTFGYWFRYEASGSLWLTAHVACSLGALAATRRRTAWLLAAAAGASLIAALWAWRVSFMLPVLETGFVLAWVLVCPPGEAVRRWFTATIAAGTLACAMLGYLRAQAFGLSTGWLMAMTTAAALWLPAMRDDRASRLRRAVVLAVAIVVALVVGAAGGAARRDRQYTHVADAAARRVLATLGVREGRPAPMTAVALRIEELESSTIPALVGPGGLSGLGLWFLGAPLAWWLAGRRATARGLPGPAPALLAFLCVTLTVITLLFVRNKVVLAPLAAVTLGGLGATLRDSLAARRGRHERTPGLPWAWALVALFAISFALTAADAVRLALTRTSALEPGLAQALAALAADGAREPVLSTWERGYEIQAYAGRPTLVDGLLEDRETQRRVVEIARAWLDPSADSLAAVCRRYGATDVLVPPSRYLFATAMLTDWPAAWKVRDGIALSREDARPVMVRMMVLGDSLPPFEKVFDRERWRIYRLPPDRGRAR